MHRLRSDRFSRARRAVQTAAALLFCFSFAAPIRAQTTRVRTPDKGVIGYGVEGGVLFPDATFENTLTYGGFGEYYVSPRVSVRALLTFANPGFAGTNNDSFRQTKLNFSGV